MMNNNRMNIIKITLFTAIKNQNGCARVSVMWHGTQEYTVKQENMPMIH